MSDVAAAVSPRRWYKPGIADVLFLLAALAVVRGAQHSLLDDPGLGWHLRNIDAMRAEGGWLRTDPFTDPREGDPPRWFTNQWLGELPFYLGWKWAGLEGIAIVNAIIIALLARFLYLSLLRDGLNWPMALLWSALGMMGTSCSWNARPNLFTILFVFFTADVCVRLHQGRVSRWTGLLLVAMFAIWANTHGGFLAGLVILAATLGIELAIALGALDLHQRQQVRQRFLQVGLLTIGAGLATLLNPYGVELYTWTFQLLGNPTFMNLHQEWLSPDFRSAGAIRYELLILLFPVVLAVSARRISLVELGLSILWLHFALTGFRYVALWVVVAIPIMARASMEIPYLRELARRWQLSTDPGSLFHTPPGSPGWLWSGVIVIALIGWARMAEGNFAVHTQKIIAHKALDRLIELAQQWKEEKGERPVIFHGYDWGGYITWHGWPELKNWIDDRNEVQGKERIQEYFDLVKAEPGWEERLGRVELVCIPPEFPLARQLAEKTGWQERYRDEYAVIFERSAN